MNNWISVKDRLPDETMNTLVFDVYDNMMVARFHASGKKWWSLTLKGNRLNVTHWMPLPSPPGVPMSNADHIRGLSDEELAKIFITTPSCVGDECSEDGDCTKCMLNWLRQPWEGDNNA